MSTNRERLLAGDHFGGSTLGVHVAIRCRMVARTYLARIYCVRSAPSSFIQPSKPPIKIDAKDHLLATLVGPRIKAVSLMSSFFPLSLSSEFVE